jgi:hypothetical protein
MTAESSFTPKILSKHLAPCGLSAFYGNNSSDIEQVTVFHEVPTKIVYPFLCLSHPSYRWLKLRTQEMHAEYYRDLSQSDSRENQQGDEWECLSDTAWLNTTHFFISRLKHISCIFITDQNTQLGTFKNPDN